MIINKFYQFIEAQGPFVLNNLKISFRESLIFEELFIFY